VPVVALWQGSSPLEFPTVDPDDRAGILAGLAHVAELGHRDIAFVSAHLQGDFRQREDAYVEFMDEHLGGVPEGYLQRVPNTLAGGEAALRELFALPKPPTAVCTSTDLVAIGVLHAAHALGATVPERLSVVGFDDILIAAHTVPALTTLRMPITEMVRHAVGQVIDLARDNAAPRTPIKLLFEPPLIVRESTAPPPA
jgi:DNA-binding LacI/PurR family transcriptional regulator